jgi:hypothetical protein
MPGCLARPGMTATVLFELAMILLLSSPMLPLIDFYNHLTPPYMLAHHRSSSLLQVALAGDLKKTDDRLRELAPVPPDEDTRDFNAYITAAFAAGYDYILACNMQIPLRPFPPPFTFSPGPNISR